MSSLFSNPTNQTKNDTAQNQSSDLFADLEQTLHEVAETNPRIDQSDTDDSRQITDLRALLEASLAVNSSLVLDDLLQLVMKNAVGLMQAERGLVMLLDADSTLQVRSAYNLCKEEMMEEDFKVSSSITSQVAGSGKSIYTSDALADDRYANQQSVVELHLRSIMCVPLVVKEQVIGVIYLDNSSQSRMFLKSDLYLFELYAQLVSNTLHNSGIYESLLRMERYNVSIVNSSPVGIVVLDAAGNIATMNVSALEIFDINKGDVEFAGQSDSPTAFLPMLPDTQRSRWQSLITTCLATHEEHADPRFYHTTRYLEKVLSIKLSPLEKLPHGLDGLIMTVEDVTEKMTMEQYVILSEKLVAKGEMAASVAHELNNYLSIITNNAELLSLNIDRGKLDKARFNSKSITEAVFKTKRFVDNLMDFSRPESEFIMYDLRTLIDDVLFSLRIQPRFKLTNFTVDLPDSLPHIEIDVGQIQQVLMNLLINSADAISERAANSPTDSGEYKGEITVRAKYQSDSQQATVQITDNGIGMSEETLSRIFALHFTTKKGGHGLGLHNCRKIVEQHHGELFAESVLGEGTTFTTSLPLQQPGEKKNE